MNKSREENIMLTEVSINSKETTPLLDPMLKHELLKELEPEILVRIKKGFDLYKGSVTINQFVVIMVDVLFQQNNWRKYTRQIMTFIQLFLLIDLNHLQRIKFQEFTNYLIDREEKDAYKEECQFVPSTKLNELELHAEKVFKFQGTTNLGILTNNKKNVEILEKKTFKRIDCITCGGPLINNIIFIPKYNVYCLASNDKHLSFYENLDHTLVRRFSVPDNIYFLQIFGQGSQYKLICGSTNGHLYQFSVQKILSIMDKKNKESQKQQQKKIKEYPQDKQYKYYSLNKMIQGQPDISCMDVMKALQILVTGANDSKVRLYEMKESGLHLSKELDGHYKGIKGISIEDHHKLIVSCSFDFDILVWNAYLEHPVARLQGHEAPLVNVECPKNYQIIISMDTKSIMKIWSSENYQLLQNIAILENFPANTSINFIFKNESNLALVWTKKIKFFEYVVNYNPKLTDDNDITAIKYSNKNLQVYIGSKRCLKVWSVTKGIQTKNYKNVVQTDISIIELDDRQRRCFIGTIEGQIISIDLFSGLTINLYSSHTQQISMLVYFDFHKLLISGGWDKRLKIHNDTHHLERIENRQNVMRNINNVGEKDLNGGCFSASQLFIATHCKTNACRIWDFEKGFLQAQILVPNQIVNILFVDPLPLIIIVDVKGTIYIFSTKYHLKSPYKLLTQWKNMYSIQKSSQISYISSKYQMIEQEIKCQLILGDEYGYIRIVDISNFIADKEIKPITADMIGNKNPYRIEDYNYIGTTQKSSNTHDFTMNQTNNIVPPGNIRQKLQIKAHHDRITYVAFINQSAEQLILTSGSDNLVKIWTNKGQVRGIMRQGLTENKHWNYQLNKQWSNKETLQYLKIKSQLKQCFEEHMLKKRMEVVPFTDDNIFQEINNDQIYKDLREVQGYLQNKTKKSSNRLY